MKNNKIYWLYWYVEKVIQVKSGVLLMTSCKIQWFHWFMVCV